MEFNFKKGTDSVDKIISRLDFLQTGVEYTIQITRAKSKRSLNQNRLMWMWLRCIAENVGSTPQDIHDVYCEHFLKTPIIVNGKQTFKTRTTRALKVDEMTEFLRNIQVHAASELGIVLPSPEDNNYNYFEEQYG
jgi:hypothetical protein